MIKNIIFDFGGVLVDWNSQRFIASIFLFLRRERDSLAQFFCAYRSRPIGRDKSPHPWV